MTALAFQEATGQKATMLFNHPFIQNIDQTIKKNWVESIISKTAKKANHKADDALVVIEDLISELESGVDAVDFGHPDMKQIYKGVEKFHTVFKGLYDVFSSIEDKPSSTVELEGDIHLMSEALGYAESLLWVNMMIADKEKELANVKALSADELISKIQEAA